MATYSTDYALFLGREEEGYICEFVGGESFFLTLEVKQSLSKESARSLLHNIEAEIVRTHPTSLAGFVEIVDTTFSTVEMGLDDAFAAALIINDIVYVITKGKGAVLLNREGELHELIKHDMTASGRLADGDMMLFTSLHLLTLADRQTLQKHIARHSPKEIVEELTPVLKEKDDKGIIALFVRFTMQSVEETAVIPVVPQRQSMLALAASFFARALPTTSDFSKRRRLTFVVVFILFVILLWSVVFGYQRRERAALAKKVAISKEKIESKLTEAEDLSTLNLDQSLRLIAEAKEELSSLKESVGDKKNEEIDKLEQEIAEREKKIARKDEKNAEIFYELSLIEKDATAISMYLEEDSVILLNPSKEKVYILSLSKKATESIRKKEFSKGIKAATYTGSIFALTKEAVYKKAEDEESLQSVIKDDEWGSIIDMGIYNGNIYLLDREKDEIYKYLVAEEGYSDKTSYFKSGAVDLKNASSLAIDSSLYVTVGANVFKYTGGVRDTFTLQLPEGEDYSFDKIFTNKESTNVYLLDKTRGKIIVTAKNGAYQKQIDAAVFKDARDFIVVEKAEDSDGKGIFVLTSDKIYRVEL